MSDSVTWLDRKLIKADFLKVKQYCERACFHGISRFKAKPVQEGGIGRSFTTRFNVDSTSNRG